SELLTRLEQSRTDPTAIARRAATRAGNPYPPDDVRYTPTIDEEIARIKATDLDAVKAFYAKFYGTSHAEIAVVGDFDADAVRPLLGRLFGDLRSATPYARVPQPFYPTKSSPQSFDTPDKANAAMFGRLSMPFNVQSPDYAALCLTNRQTMRRSLSPTACWAAIRIRGSSSAYGFATDSRMRSAPRCSLRRSTRT